jgi:hypothetical protein
MIGGRAGWSRVESQAQETGHGTVYTICAYLGLVPSEHSSGGRRRIGAITKSGDIHTRTVPIEAAWSYRFPARDVSWSCGNQPAHHGMINRRSVPALHRACPHHDKSDG